MKFMILPVGSAIFLVLIFFPFVIWGRQILKTVCAFPRTTQLVMVLVLLWQAAQLVLHYPGLISSDDIHLWEHMQRYSEPSPWHSLTYSFITRAWSWISGAPYCVSLLQFIFFGFILFLIFRVFPPQTSKWTLFGLIFILSMPQSSVLIHFQNRDSLYSLLILWLFIGLIAQGTPAKQDPWFKPWTLIILCLILGDLRQEGKFLLALVPLALWWNQLEPVSALFKRFVAIAIIAVLVYVLPSKTFNMDLYPPIYKSTAFLNPLSHIFFMRGAAAATTEEIKQIEKLVSISDLVEEYTPLDIGPFHKGKVNGISEDDFNEVKAAAIDVLLKNWDLYLENRYILVLNMLNFKGAPFMFGSEFYNQSELAQKHLIGMQRVAYGLPKPIHYLFSSFLIPLAALLLGLCYFKTRPEIFSASMINVIRLGIVIAAAPAAYFKYVSSSWVFGWILFFYILEVKRTFKRPPDVGP